uniref:Uncharacterized protein n=2 Tax=Wuchereria bancrofti TaxID=6293 RepID=A0A1I8EF18_WUCBA
MRSQYFWITFIIMLPSFETNASNLSIHRNCIVYTRNHTICTTLKACRNEKCASNNCESISAIHFRNNAVILNKLLRNKPHIKQQLNPLLYDPLKTSIFAQEESGAYCGEQNKLLKNVKIRVLESEEVFQQLLRKASFQQQRYLYAQDDCLNKCNILGINLDCELVPDDDMEVIKTAAFKHLQHMIFFQCGQFPMLLIIMAIVIVILTIVAILELAIGISRIRTAKERSKTKDKDKMTIEGLSMSTTKSRIGSKSISNESTNLSTI